MVFEVAKNYTETQKWDSMGLWWFHTLDDWCPKSSLQFSVVEEWVLYLSTLHIQKETIITECKDWLADTDQFEDDDDDDLGGFVCNLSFHYTSDTIYRPQILTGWGILEVSCKGNCNSKNQEVEGMWNKKTQVGCWFEFYGATGIAHLMLKFS